MTDQHNKMHGKILQDRQMHLRQMVENINLSYYVMQHLLQWLQNYRW